MAGLGPAIHVSVYGAKDVDDNLVLGSTSWKML